MKRPEGFDRDREEPAKPAPPDRSRKPVVAERRESRASARSQPTPGRAKRGEPRAATGKPPAAERPGRDKARPTRPRRARVARDDAAAEARKAAAEAKREARRAAAERRRYERAEVRRFTRRQRNRRITLAVIGGLVATMIGLVAVAVYSPLLALREITIDGTSRVDAEAVRERLDEQLGTPLALVDYGRIDAALREFPVIRSYRTETIPPGTIRVHIVERQPIVSVEKPTGGYLFVDAAGVAVEESAQRLPGVPLVTESSTAIPNPAFDAAVEVLLAMPADLRQTVDTVAARSRDDVTLTLTGAPQTVEWGSADDSVRKAELLAVLRAIHGSNPGTFDVSATSNGIFRPA